MADSTAPEYNITGHDYRQRSHFRYFGPPIIDIHSHVMMTSPSDNMSGPPVPVGPTGSSDAAALMLQLGEQYHVGLTVSMCPAIDIVPLRERLGATIRFNGMLGKKPDEPDDAAYRNLDAFLEAGIDIIKLWAAPRGRDRGYTLDPPWRIECVRRARAAGIRTVMVHVGDPDRWWLTTYQDTSKYGTKPDQYIPLRRMLDMFPDMIWIGAHMGGDPEHPNHLQELLETYPHLHFDTSATKWQVREVSKHPQAIRQLIERFPDRFLFGTDLVTRHTLGAEHYESRYWCQRTLWESEWSGPSPIADPDHEVTTESGPTPKLCGVGLSEATLRKVYHDNARRILFGD